MHAAISSRRIISIFCLLLTLVISLFIGNYYFADEVVLEGLTGGGNTDAATEAAKEAKNSAKEAKNSAKEAKAAAEEAKKASASGSSMTSSPSSSTRSSMTNSSMTNSSMTNSSMTNSSMTSSPSSSSGSFNTGITEAFELQYAPVSNETHISTSPEKQPPMPSQYNRLGVFNHVFGMSNPNEQFVIPRI